MASNLFVSAFRQSSVDSRVLEQPLHFRCPVVGATVTGWSQEFHQKVDEQKTGVVGEQVERETLWYLDRKNQIGPPGIAVGTIATKVGSSGGSSMVCHWKTELGAEGCSAVFRLAGLGSASIEPSVVA